MTDERPGFTHRPARHGLIGPFSGRQLLLPPCRSRSWRSSGSRITTPLGNTAGGPSMVEPARRRRSSSATRRPEGLQARRPSRPSSRPTLDDGSTYQLTDLDGQPIRLEAPARQGRLAQLLGVAGARPASRRPRSFATSTSSTGTAASPSSGSSVQETAAGDVSAYADRYELDYTIGFDGSGHVFRTYRVFAPADPVLPRPDGVIASVGKTVDEAAAVAAIEALLP